MFLTKVVLNPARSGTHNLVSNPRAMHAAVQKSFPNENDRILWRLSLGQRDPQLYIFSPNIPSVEHIIEQAGRVNDNNGVITKDYSPVLAGIRNDAKYRLQCDVNITVCKQKKRVPLYRPEDINAWIVRQGRNNGFILNDEAYISPKIPLVVKKDGHTVTLDRVTLDFTATVTDRDLFTKLLKTGIGRGKAYGLGLLVVGKP